MVKHIDTVAMRNKAGQIRVELKKYNTAKADIEETIKGTKSYWQDDANTGYVKKYETEMQLVVNKAGNLMKQYADFLEEAANAYAKLNAKANGALN